MEKTLKCLRCGVPLRRKALRTRRNYMDDDSLFAKLRVDELDDDTVFVTDPYNAAAYVQGHSALDAWVCPSCGHVELIAARLDTLFASSRTEIVCPHCAKSVTVDKEGDSAWICPACGKNIHEKVPGRNYIRPKNF